MSDTLLETVAAAPGGLPDTTAPSGRQWGPAWWIARRLLLGVAVLLAVSIIIFAATQALPGDAARAILGPTATPARVAVLRHQLGLDRPLINQYWSWLTGALHFDFGQSLAARQPVSSVIGWRIENTLSLLFASAVVSIPVSMFIGIVAAVRRPVHRVQFGTGQRREVGVADLALGLGARIRLRPAPASLVSGRHRTHLLNKY